MSNLDQDSSNASDTLVKNNTTDRTAEADLALIKSMMVAGRRRMGIDGVHLIIWGAILSLAFLAQYLSVMGIIPKTVLGVWLPTYAIGGIASYFAAKNIQRQAIEENLALSVYSTAWSTVGLGIAIYLIASVLADNFNPSTITMLTAAGFAASFSIVSVITGLQKLKYVAYGWWVLLAYFAYFGTHGANILLILCGACILLILLPGMLLKRMIGRED
ncbi:MAG: hypothetical protein JKY57_02010 [Kordiimonadaceae bacterium]|nr:hypothetical protein [Kordiimonadaceae bacterium]